MSTKRKLLASAIILAAVTAMGVSAYLTWSSWQATGVAGCTADGADCDAVLGSRWSQWLGLPVAAFGSVIYLAIAAVCWPAARHPQRTAMSLLVGLSLMAVGAALWFVGIQLFELQSFCLYCLSAHACGLLIGLLTLALYFADDLIDEPDQTRTVIALGGGTQIPSLVAGGTRDEPGISPLVTISVASMALAGLVGGQLLMPTGGFTAIEEIELKPIANRSLDAPRDDAPDFMDSDSKSQSDAAEVDETNPVRLLNFAALAEPLNAHAVPLVGSVDAEHVVVEMLDYTCSHCRQLHPRLVAARQRYGDQLAFVVYHAPLSSECNDHLPPGKKGRPSACDYARLAIGVWMLAPEKFSEYHDWLMEGTVPPNLPAARNRAMNLAGDRILLDDALRADITTRLRRQCDDWHRIDSGLPLLLFSESAVRGGGKSNEELFGILEQKLGIAPAGSVTASKGAR